MTFDPRTSEGPESVFLGPTPVLSTAFFCVPEFQDRSCTGCVVPWQQEILDNQSYDGIEHASTRPFQK